MSRVTDQVDEDMGVIEDNRPSVDEVEAALHGDGSYIESNLPIALIMDWMGSAGVDLSNANITMQCGPYRPYNQKLGVRKTAWRATVSFNHDDEWGENLRTLKKAIGGKFAETGEPPYMELHYVRDIVIGKMRERKLVEGTLETRDTEIEMKVTIVIRNSFECETKCKPKHSELMEELASDA